MRFRLSLLAALLCAGTADARYLGLGVDAFNRAVPVSSPHATVFSPLSFEIDSVIFAEAVDPIRRSQFAAALHVMDEFEAEYSPLARLPFERPATNGLGLVWAHAIVVDEPRRIDPAFRLTVQGLYGVEVCRAAQARGVEAWVRTRFAGDFDGWRLPVLPKGEVYALHDIVSVSATAAVTNGLKRTYPTHALYRMPLVGGANFYAVVPKPGRPLASVRARVTSLSLPEILAASSALTDPPVPVRVSVPPLDLVATNELAGAFSYFRLPTAALKPFPPGMKPVELRQTVRFRLRTPPPEPEAEGLDGPFLFFIHDPAADTLPVIGVFPGKGDAR